MTDAAPAAGPPPMPRWVKAFVILLILFVLLVVVLLLTGIGGDHGPGRHGAGMLIGGSWRLSWHGRGVLA